MREKRRFNPFKGIMRWMHPLLVVSTLLYLYSPFLDHWFGFDAQTRQHTHISINAPLLFSVDFEAELAHHHAHDEDAEAAEDIYLCALDLDANFSLLLGAFILPDTDVSIAETSTTAATGPYQAVATIFSAIATPPPNLL